MIEHQAWVFKTCSVSFHHRVPVIGIMCAWFYLNVASFDYISQKDDLSYRNKSTLSSKPDFKFGKVDTDINCKLRFYLPQLVGTVGKKVLTTGMEPPAEEKWEELQQQNGWR